MVKYLQASVDVINICNNVKITSKLHMCGQIKQGIRDIFSIVVLYSTHVLQRCENFTG